MATLTEVAGAEALTLDYLASLDQLAEALGRIMREAWDNLPAYERAQMAGWLAEVEPVAGAGLAEGADLAAAYLTELTGATLKAAEIDLTVPALDAPFLRHGHLLKQGYDWQDARDGGAGQAEMLGNDVVRDGAGRRMEKPGTKTIAWQRVVKPGACEFCQVVATQMYKTFQSASHSHHKCRCLPPIAVTEENAEALRKLNSATLKSLRGSGAVQRVSDARERNRERARKARASE